MPKNQVMANCCFSFLLFLMYFIPRCYFQSFLCNFSLLSSKHLFISLAAIDLFFLWLLFRCKNGLNPRLCHQFCQPHDSLGFPGYTLMFTFVLLLMDNCALSEKAVTSYTERSLYLFLCFSLQLALKHPWESSLSLLQRLFF